jgi:hypothetical protein
MRDNKRGTVEDRNAEEMQQSARRIQMIIHFLEKTEQDPIEVLPTVVALLASWLGAPKALEILAVIYDELQKAYEEGEA